MQRTRFEEALAALQQDRADLQELAQAPGWVLVQEMVRQQRDLAERVLRDEKEPQALFQAQGVFKAFDRLDQTIRDLSEASDEELAMLVPKEAGE